VAARSRLDRGGSGQDPGGAEEVEEVGAEEGEGGS